MSQHLVYLDRSQIREGKLADVKAAIPDLVDFVERQEPRLLAYGFHVDEEAHRMTVVAIHPDSASLELHMEIGGPRFRHFSDLLDLEAIEVYGEPSDRVVERLREKAEMLGDEARLVVQSQHAGFARLASETT